MADAVNARIQYLRPTSRINRRFWARGEELNTGVYDPYPVTVRNARLATKPFTLDEHGFAIGEFPTAVTDFEDQNQVKDIYDAEIIAAAKAFTGADHVALMSGQIRSSGRTGDLVQPPAAEAHVDFNPATSQKIARSLYQRMAPNGPGFDRFIIFSLWRVLSDPPQDWPLALCEARSVDPEEGVSNTKVDVDKIPETEEELFAPIPGEEDMAAATIFFHNPSHRWWYFPDMTPDELIFIKFHDSDHSVAWRTPHTAFHDAAVKAKHPRRSMEYRGVVYFSKKSRR